MFHLPVDGDSCGFYTDKYFGARGDILLADSHTARVMMRVGGKTPGFLSGVDEAIAILKLCSKDWSALTVHALYEGDQLKHGTRC